MRYYEIIENERSIMPAPQRWLDPNHREYRPGLGDYAPGGKYLHMPSKEDVTGQTVANGFIDVSGGRPVMKVSHTLAEPAQRSAGPLLKTNLFKQTAGWRWVDETPALAPVKTVISVTRGSAHIYALRVDFESGMTLTRYANAKDEPRLRPSTHGTVDIGQPVGMMVARGRPHTVYDRIIIR